MHITRRALLGAGAAGAALLTGCATAPAPEDEGARLHALLDRTVTELLRLSPERCTSLGIGEARAGGRYIDRVSDAANEGMRRYRATMDSAITALNEIDRAQLSPQDAVTLEVVKTSAENNIAAARYEVGNGAGSPYVVTQLTGVYTNYPDFLNAQHPVRTRDEADAYLTRLSLYPNMLDQETAIVAEDAAAGVIPPDFAIDRALVQLNAFAALAPAETVLVQTLVRRLPENPEVPE